jgi:hypothetical protein
MRPLMITLAAVAGLAFCAPAGAADDDDDFKIPEVIYPRLADQADAAQGFVPAGWVLEKNISGDLNRDGIPDLVLVLRDQSPANVIKHSTIGTNPLNTNPRILAVAFGRKAPASGFTLAMQDHTLIPRHTAPNIDDPLQEGDVGISRGTLQVKLGFFASSGSWTTSMTTFTFRYQNGKFELIGYDRFETARNSGVTSDLSINYMTRKVKIATGSIENDAKKVRWVTLPRRPLLTIDKIGDGLDFDAQK